MHNEQQIIIIGLLKIKRSSHKADLCLGLQYKNTFKHQKPANIQYEIIQIM